MSETDIIIEPDLLIQGGDIVFQNANNQTIKHLLISFGNYLLNPQVGAGLYRLQNAAITDFRMVVDDIKSELRKDGFNGVAVGGQYDNITSTSTLTVTGTRVTNPTRALL